MRFCRACLAALLLAFCLVSAGTSAYAASLDEGEFLQPGHRQRAAGMIVYGPHTDLVVTLGAGTHVATLDPT